MLEKKVFKTSNGVNIKLTGDVKKDQVQSMLDSCVSDKECACECDCDSIVMEKIEDKIVSGENGKVIISLVGKDIEVQEIQNALKGCDF